MRRSLPHVAALMVALEMVAVGCEQDPAPSSDGGAADGGAGSDAAAALPWPCHPPRDAEGPWVYVRPAAPGAITAFWGPPDFLTVDGAGPLSRLLWSPDEGKTWCQIPTPLPPVQALRPVDEPAQLFMTAIDPATNQVRLLRTRDFGESWERLEQTLPKQPASFFVLKMPRPMLVLTFSDGGLVPVRMLVSTDDGKTFEPRGLTVPGGPQDSPSSVLEMLADPVDPTVLLAVVTFWQPDPRLPPGNLSPVPTVVASTDAGESWRLREVPDSDRLDEVQVHPDGRLLTLAQDGMISIREPGAGEWRSTGTVPVPLRARSLFTGFSQRDTFYLTGITVARPERRLAFKSSDAGGTWSTLIDADFNEGIQPVEPGFLVGLSGIGLRTSRDDGKTWSQRLHTPGRQTHVTVGSGDASRIYSYSYEAVIRSDDSGQTWSGGFVESHGLREIVPDPGNRDVLYALVTPRTGGQRRILRSDDAGARWSSLELPQSPSPNDFFAVLPLATPPGAVLMSTDLGVFRSEDRGATWQLASTDVRGPLRSAPSDPGTVVAVGPGLPFSRDGGKTWTGSVDINAFVHTLAFHPTNADRVYLLDRSQFLVLTLGPPMTVVRSQSFLGADPTGNRSLLAATASGHIYLIDQFDRLWHSPDEGSTWDKPQGGRSLSQDKPDGTLFLSVIADPARPDSILVSTDSGLLRTRVE